MNYLTILLISVIILLLLVGVLMLNSKIGHNISQDNNKLIIKHPLKEDVIDLNADISNWKLQRANYWRLGRIYALNLELKSGKHKKVYSRSVTGKFGKLVEYLQRTKEKEQK
ncbi:hypothetical protein J2X69_000226 [Algoriphagus sp. 4150]|uniref:hypothetical protein n=1 Tax=Algoriphagus sp. 4150 TaxID=2817756 RepID=UPI00285AF892|nr:hypothetical protein [Algoriphagus sp. 4150]MDR7127898.1 hypothetical protein [Algoriphagus sp. 4150]